MGFDVVCARDTYNICYALFMIIDYNNKQINLAKLKMV